MVRAKARLGRGAFGVNGRQTAHRNCQSCAIGHKTVSGKAGFPGQFAASWPSCPGKPPPRDGYYTARIYHIMGNIIPKPAAPSSRGDGAARASMAAAGGRWRLGETIETPGTLTNARWITKTGRPKGRPARRFLPVVPLAAYLHAAASATSQPARSSRQDPPRQCQRSALERPTPPLIPAVSNST